MRRFSRPIGSAAEDGVGLRTATRAGTGRRAPAAARKARRLQPFRCPGSLPLTIARVYAGRSDGLKAGLESCRMKRPIFAGGCLLLAAWTAAAQAPPEKAQATPPSE